MQVMGECKTDVERLARLITTTNMQKRQRQSNQSLTRRPTINNHQHVSRVECSSRTTAPTRNGSTTTMTTGTGTMRKTVSVDRSTSSNIYPTGIYENDIFVIPVHRVIAKTKPTTVYNRSESDDDDDEGDNNNIRRRGGGVKVVEIPKLHLESINASISKSNDLDDGDLAVETLGAAPYVKPIIESEVKQNRRHTLQTNTAGNNTNKSELKINGSSLDLEMSEGDVVNHRIEGGECLRINIQTCQQSSTENSESEDQVTTPEVIRKPSKIFFQKRKPVTITNGNKNIQPEHKPRGLVMKPKITLVDRQNRQNGGPCEEYTLNGSSSVPPTKEVKERDHEMVCPHCKFRWNVNLQTEAKRDLDYFKRRFNIDMPLQVNSNTAHNSQLFSYLNAAKRKTESSAPAISRPRINSTNLYTCNHCNTRGINSENLSTGQMGQQVCNNQSCQNFHNQFKFDGMNQYCFHCFNPSQQSQTQPTNTNAGSMTKNNTSDNVQDLTNNYLSKNPIFNTIPRGFSNGQFENQPQQPQQQQTQQAQTSSQNQPSVPVQSSQPTSQNGPQQVANTNLASQGGPSTQGVTQSNVPNGNNQSQSPFNLFNHNCKMYTPFAAINPWNTLRYVNGVTNGVHGINTANTNNRFVNTSVNSTNQFPTPYYWSQV